MSDAYGKVKGGRLTFKGGDLATRSKSIDKSKKKKKNKNKNKPPPQRQIQDQDPTSTDVDPSETSTATAAGGDGGGDIYTIDAAKRMKYDQLFPVEAKKFGYDPIKATSKSVEEALDDRVKKKADRYCK